MQIPITNPMGEDRCVGRKEKTRERDSADFKLLSHKNKPREKCWIGQRPITQHLFEKKKGIRRIIHLVIKLAKRELLGQ